MVKVAVIGSGLAGLTVSHLLTNSREETGLDIEVHVFEKSPTFGMDAESVTLSSTGQRIDIPMRSFQGYYPRLIALYQHIGAVICKADFSYSFSTLQRSPPVAANLRAITTRMIYEGSSGRNGIGIPSNGHNQDVLSSAERTYCWLQHCLSLLFTAVFFFRMVLHSIPCLRVHKAVTFDEWITEKTPSSLMAKWLALDVRWREFANDVLIPLFSAVCTAGRQDVLNHPVEEFLDYTWLTFGTHHYLVDGGVQNVVARLSSVLRNVHFSSHIASVRPDPANPALSQVVVQAPGGSYQVHSGFQHIILATTAPQAATLVTEYLASLSKEQSEHRATVEELARCLETFQCRQAIVINHTDEGLLPTDRRDRRDLNLIMVDDDTQLDEKQTRDCVDRTCAMTTHILSSRASDGQPVYQTTNPTVPPRKECIINVSRLWRGLLTVESKRALEGLHRIVPERSRWGGRTEKGVLGPLQGAGRAGDKSHPGLWVCGAYASNGIPLLEGCVVSAELVADAILEREGVDRSRIRRSW